MEDLSTKIMNDDLSAVEFVQPMSEIQKLITNEGIALSAGDPNQLAKALSSLISSGDFYTATGAMPTKILTSVGSHQPLHAYVAGMKIRFRSTDASTSTCTINIDGLGPKSIIKENGNALDAGEIPANSDMEVRYDGTDFLVIRSGAKTYPIGHISGGLYEVLNAAPGDTTLISDLHCRDSNNLVDIDIASGFSKEFTTAFALGSGNGGFAGTRTVDSGYYFFAIKNVDGSQDLGFDSSETAANLLAAANAIGTGWTYYRTLGRVHNASGSDTFVEAGKTGPDPTYFEYRYAQDETWSATTVATDRTIVAPILTTANLTVTWVGSNSLGYGALTETGLSATFPSSSRHHYATGDDSEPYTSSVRVNLDNASQTESKETVSTGTITAMCNGFWFDRAS